MGLIINHKTQSLYEVICAGFSRTGTKSMSEALRLLGYENVHDFFEHSTIDGKYWRKIFDCRGTIDDFRDMYENVDAVADVPANMFWEEILHAFPGAKVILTVRDNEDQWFNSFRSYLKFVGENLFFERHRTLGTLVYRITPSGYAYLKHCIDSCTLGFAYFPSWNKTNELILRNCYRRHNRNVINGCPPSNLLVFNVKEGWGPLCKFLDKNVPQEIAFPRENRASEAFMLKFMKGKYKYDGGLRKRVVKEISIRVTFMFIILLLIVALIATICTY